MEKNKQSTVPPAYHWYEAKCPGGSLSLQCNGEKWMLTYDEAILKCEGKPSLCTVSAINSLSPPPLRD
ncbi:hypothetical protein TNCV_2680671 [Trichonephila clavipes]|uniref:Uncharacterized protein n=1 Tax=Trichonephila clavipes TaxID=2585209 RepID=A0A8X6VHJ7_TRICX|nr:hypothetical protein TNCV_2680671 [Trichonephila clavipes]